MYLIHFTQATSVCIVFPGTGLLCSTVLASGEAIGSTELDQSEMHQETNAPNMDNCFFFIIICHNKSKNRLKILSSPACPSLAGSVSDLTIEDNRGSNITSF